MSDTVRRKAAESETMVEEVTATVLPEPKQDIVPLEQAEPAAAEAIRKRIAEIDMGDTNSIVSFGSAAQAELQQISQAMLADVKNKDVGPAGDSLRDIVSAIRGFSVSELDVGRKRSLWDRILGRATPMAKFTARFEEVQGPDRPHHR